MTEERRHALCRVKKEHLLPGEATPWMVEFRCYYCNEELIGRERLDFKNVCPHCGQVNEIKGDVFPRSNRYISRFVRTDSPRWWQFWKKPAYRKEYR